MTSWAIAWNHLISKKKLDLLVRQTANEVDADLNAKIVEQRALVNSDLFKSNAIGSAALNSALANYQSKHPDFTWVGIADTKGVIRNDSRDLLTGQDASKRPWYIKGSDGTYFGDLHEAVLLQNLIAKDSKEMLRFIDIANPIYDVQHQLKGILSVHINWEWANRLLSDNLNTEDRDNQVELFILSPQGVVIYPMKSQYEKALTEQDITGKKYLIAKATLNVMTVDSQSQWQVLAREPIANIEHRINFNFWWLFGWVCSSIIFVYFIIGVWVFF